MRNNKIQQKDMEFMDGCLNMRDFSITHRGRLSKHKMDLYCVGISRSDNCHLVRNVSGKYVIFISLICNTLYVLIAER